MKKILLFGAAAFMACTMNAQTLTGNLKLDWEISMADHTTTETRSIGAIGDKAILNNSTTGKVELWDATGKVKEYDVNGWLKENGYVSGKDDKGNDVYEIIGRGASVDEVGNIVINLNFSLLGSSRQFLIIAPDGKMTKVDCEIPSGVVMPDGGGRCDFLGDKMAGNMLKDGYVVTCPNKSQYAMAFNIVEGKYEPDFSYGIHIGDKDNTEEWNTESTCIFLESYNPEDGVLPKFIARNRGIGGFRISNKVGESEYQLDKMTYEGEGMINWGAATCTNFTAFNVAGKYYAVVNQPDDGKRTHSWEVFDLQNAATLARWTMPVGEAVNYMGGFASSVNEDGTVNIFQFNPGIRLAKYTFTVPTGNVNEIEADENAPVEYYNLQGVKVANPEGGIFIKKQGSKAEKVLK